MGSARRHPKSHSVLSYGVIVLFLAGCSGRAGGTQPPVVIQESAARCDRTPAVPGRDPYESALARARCEHPDMLVHPRAYVLRRVASPPNVARFALEQPASGTRECCYEVTAEGAVWRVR
jgi:hypothetical protein